MSQRSIRLRMVEVCMDVADPEQPYADIELASNERIVAIETDFTMRAPVVRSRVWIAGEQLNGEGRLVNTARCDVCGAAEGELHNQLRHDAYDRGEDN